MWRHKKRGTTYDIVGEATVQISGWTPIIEPDEVVVYRSLEDGRLWVRPKHQFYDGRFEEVSE